ncbi:MucBP domain-containing protein, partial [Streptococcus oralis subsp. tigurinus]|uniref:lectin-like domain-containing protein n=1 Tax=Streptococcus oralis TaxID=1303 RepID=UPI0039C211E1
MDKNARRRLRRASTEKRLRYSVRKFSAGVASVAVAAFMFFGGNVVSADMLATADSSSTSTEKTTSVPDSGKNSRMDDSESAVGKDSTVTTVAESNAVSSATSTVSSTSAEDLSSKVEDKNVKSEATSKSEAVLKEATSQASKDSVATSQSAAPAAQSEAPAASATAKPKASVEKAASQAPDAVAKSEANSTLAADQGKVNKGYAGFRKAGQSGFRSAGQQTEGKTTVTKENFLDYFNLNGSATYNSQDGIVTLTPDETSKGGNFSLKSKINMNQSFKLAGKVNLGSKTQAQGGADGIGFAFHTGNTDDLGALGGNLGIGGLRNATGFKLDTFWNPYAQPKGERFNTNDTTFFQYGWAEDPKNIGSQFGAWVNTTLKKIKGDGGEYERWWADTDPNDAQGLDSTDLDGRFHKFTIDYDGSTKELTISYESNAGTKQWKKKVSTPEELMSMAVSASTGSFKNLQQFQIERFEFYQGASINVRYVDEEGRDIAEGSVNYPQGAYKGKAYTTEQKKIPNYEYVGLAKDSLPASGNLADWGSNGTVTYVYRQGKELITDPAKLNKKVTRTIKYEYADGETAGRPALKAPVTQEAAFTRTGERNRVTGVETFDAWTPATKELAQEDTPVVTGFVADKANVAAKTVTPDDKDSEEVVQYKELGSYVPNVPDGLPKVPKLPYPNDPTDPTKPGTDLPVIPHVPGTTPVGPDGTTPLTPKDPNDPSKGYNPPPIPSDPTQDTPISYVKDGQKAIITFVDQTDGNKELAKVVESGKSGEPIGTTNYAARLKELTDKGYEVVNDEFKDPQNFDNDASKDQQFVVTLRQGKEPITDPAKLNKKVTRTIKYEYADGETAGRPALKAPVTQEAAFTR